MNRHFANLSYGCRTKNITSAVALFGIVAFWGATFELVQRATTGFSVLGFLAWRFSVAALALAIYAGGKGPDRRSLAVGGMIGLVLAIAYVCQTLSLQQTDSTHTGMITGLFILFVPIFGWLCFGVRVSARVWLGVALSLAGLYLLVDPDSQGIDAGSVLALLCAVGFGLHVALVDRAASQSDVVSLTLGQLAAAALIFWISWLATRFVMRDASAVVPSWNVWLAVFATGLIGSALGFAVQTVSQRHLSAMEAAVIIMTEPVFAALVGWLCGERLDAIQWLGAAMMLGTTAWLGLAPGRVRAVDEIVVTPVPSVSPD
jgi:drug/metabolite transporter (DMT)-like permease